MPPPYILKTGTVQAQSDSISVKGKIGGTPCEMIVDTGSNITIVRPDVVERVGKALKIVPVKTSLRTVSGEAVPVQGRGEIAIQIGDHQAVHDIWVAEITDPCILGLDFLVANDCQIDMAGAFLSIGREEILLNKVTSAGEDPKCRKVVRGRRYQYHCEVSQ